MNAKYELLLKELDLIDSSIRQMDEITKGIKEWSIGAWTASVGFSIAIHQLAPYIALTAIIPFMFWLVDASYRRVQTQFINRHKEIQQFINSKDFESFINGEADFSVMKMRNKRNPIAELLSVMSFWTVCFLYLGQIFVSLVLWRLM